MQRASSPGSVCPGSRKNALPYGRNYFDSLGSPFGGAVGAAD